MPESWVQCVMRVYKQNRTKHGKGADGKFKYKFKNAMKDAKKVYKTGKTAKGRMSRNVKKGGRKSRKMKKGGEPEDMDDKMKKGGEPEDMDDKMKKGGEPEDMAEKKMVEQSAGGVEDEGKEDM